MKTTRTVLDTLGYMVNPHTGDVFLGSEAMSHAYSPQRFHGRSVLVGIKECIFLYHPSHFRHLINIFNSLFVFLRTIK